MSVGPARPLAAVLAAAVLVLTSCAGGGSGGGTVGVPGRARVDVSTPALARAKRAAGIADCAPGPGTPGGAAAGGLPPVTLPCLGGGPAVDLATLPGPRVVNLWASWCGPCRRELPHYQAFAEKHGDRVPVLGVDYQDTQPAAALALARATGVTYPLLADPQGRLDGASPIPRLAGLPFLALVDADGRVVHREFVEIRSEQQLAALVTRYLKVTL
jgi:thiol-disulfide isomerase/thioredoxin